MATTPTSIPIGYERPCAEAIPGVYRDGKYLVVDRGGNIAGFCLSCGRPSAGAPLVKHLWADRPNPFHSSGYGGGGSSGGIIDAILLVIQLIVLLFEVVWAVATLISERRASRKRTVAFGLCPAHRRRRVATIAGAWGTTGLAARGKSRAAAACVFRTGSSLSKLPVLPSNTRRFSASIPCEIRGAATAGLLPRAARLPAAGLRNRDDGA